MNKTLLLLVFIGWTSCCWLGEDPNEAVVEDIIVPEYQDFKILINDDTLVFELFEDDYTNDLFDNGEFSKTVKLKGQSDEYLADVDIIDEVKGDVQRWRFSVHITTTDPLQPFSRYGGSINYAGQHWSFGEVKGNVIPFKADVSAKINSGESRGLIARSQFDLLLNND